MTTRFQIINGKCVVPNGTTRINDYEFVGCDELQEVVLPDTVSYLGQDVSCRYVPKEIKGDDTLTYVGKATVPDEDWKDGDDLPF